MSETNREQLPLPLNLPIFGTKITCTTTLNTYEIQDKVGEGGFGIVFGCIDVWDNKLVAKIIKPRVNSSTEKDALDELNKLLLVRHPYITHVYDAFEWGGAFYIISERCSSTLAELSASDTFIGKYWAIPIAKCLLQAVHFAHVQGIVHCDIHPGNVFMKVVADEMLPNNHSIITFKLGDFGLAKVFGILDAQGTFMESIRPPEAIDPNEYGPIDHRVDIYHVGLLILNLVLEKPRTFTREEILEGVPRSIALTLESPFSFALEKALRRHVIYRTATAMEFWRDLNSPVMLSQTTG
jgi:serine/threonine protein kinase